MPSPSPTTIRSGYADLVDNATPEKLIETLGNAATAAREDAAKIAAHADELRAEAGALGDKPGMRDTAENFQQVAAEHDETAENRLQMAKAYDDRADEVANQSAA
jgi:flagellar biosynthesis/type III secretory pathway protein FliH